MNKTATISVRVKPEIKSKAETVLDKLGLSITDAITLYLQQISLRQAIPFQVELPNAETLKVIADADAGIDVHRVESVDVLFKEIGV